MLKDGPRARCCFNETRKTMNLSGNEANSDPGDEKKCKLKSQPANPVAARIKDGCRQCAQKVPTEREKAKGKGPLWHSRAPLGIGGL